MKNNQKGITLIALVVTIIVLLILAGVSIAMLTGQNGILNRASESSWKSKLGDAETTVALYVSNYLADYYAVTYTGATSDFGATYTDEADAVSKAITNVNTDLGDAYSVTEATDSKAITIVYTEGDATNGKKYSVLGTPKGSIVTWGPMTVGATPAK